MNELSNKMTPTGPCFEVGTKGYFSFWPQFTPTRTATMLGAVRGFFEKCIVFDRDGRKWRSKGIKSAYRRSWWRVLLANTIYNPKITVTPIWGQSQPYTLSELKRAYSEAVEKDDDILTQFVEATELKKRIAEAKTFDELADIYKWMKIDHSDEAAG
jgi:hypothetical protein